MVLAAKGNRLAVRGGNGSALPVPQRLLVDLTGLSIEYVIPTKSVADQFSERLPSCYKVDLADPIRRLAIEIDGATHRTVLGRERDARKTMVLTALGWSVLRFSNAEVLNDLARVAAIIVSTTSK
jgi:hypothetical protein